MKFEQGISNAYHGSAEEIWDWYTRGFGPLRQLAESLPRDRVERLKPDVDAYHQHYAVPAGAALEARILTHGWLPAVSTTWDRAIIEIF